MLRTVVSAAIVMPLGCGLKMPRTERISQVKEYGWRHRTGNLRRLIVSQKVYPKVPVEYYLAEIARLSAKASRQKLSPQSNVSPELELITPLFSAEALKWMVKRKHVSQIVADEIKKYQKGVPKQRIPVNLYLTARSEWTRYVHENLKTRSFFTELQWTPKKQLDFLLVAMKDWNSYQRVIQQGHIRDAASAKYLSELKAYAETFQ
ncbi:MAG: hypothetical protein J4215_05655 [Candidatus Diapherotrites archaeon]|uniref:Uncharacterized protein n=1 Tax=Candidatus Iainarchaeum sp. TaxID=3101447 RepID=A0A8T4LBF0_9ARCH|nr:hypothetical protein [Candidatus Diapherotrites archaeon]